MSSVADLYMELSYHQYFVRQAEKELWGYVKTAAWSSEMCARVDEIEAYLRRARADIREIRLELGLSPEEPEEEKK